jgi:hypothetical protein
MLCPGETFVVRRSFRYDDQVRGEERKMSSLQRLLVVAVLGATALAVAAGVARPATSAFVCPKSPSASPPTLWVKNYDGHRGSVWCDDGATAVVKVSTGASPLIFKGGVCTSPSQGVFISIGVLISGKRKASDPPGFKTLKWVKSTGTPESASFTRKGTFEWSDEIKITWAGLKGSWSGSDGLWIDNVYTTVKANATFTCKRIVKTAF